MTLKNKDRIREFLKGIETGDPASVAVVNEEKYIQHNPHTHEGGEGLAKLFKRLSKTSPKVNIIRAFEDGDMVFAHTEYDFSKLRIGFEVFRFEDGKAVEHWDNIQSEYGPNASGHSMVDGPTKATDLSLTENNRSLIRSFVEDVLINRQVSKIEDYISSQNFTQHNPHMVDGVEAYLAAITAESDHGFNVQYKYIHRVLAEGNFVLCVSEGFVNQTHTSFYDLFRIDKGKIVEHWDTIETVPPRGEWKNDNGKF